MPEEAPERSAAAIELRQGTIRLARRLFAERSADELSLGKLSVLGDLNRDGRVTAGQLAAAKNQRPQSLTRLLAELARDGLITRTRSDHDHRQVLLEITQDGRTALRRHMAERDAWLTTALADLTETEREVLRLAGKLMDHLAGSGGRAGCEHGSGLGARDKNHCRYDKKLFQRGRQRSAFLATCACVNPGFGQILRAAAKARHGWKPRHISRRWPLGDEMTAAG